MASKNTRGRQRVLDPAATAPPAAAPLSVTEHDQEAAPPGAEGPQATPVARADDAEGLLQLGDPLEPGTLSLKELQKWSSGSVKSVEIGKIIWDENLEYGQVRPLNMTRVQQLVRSLKAEMPRMPIRILVKRTQERMPPKFLRRSVVIFFI